MDLSSLPPHLASLDLPHYMRAALAEADEAGRAGELPIGAVLVIDGEIVSRGRACHLSSRSQLMHAELQALLAGGEPLWKRHDDAVLFTTVEPCPMCLGAAVMADVPHIVFASHDVVIDSLLAIQTVPYIRRHIRSYIGGVLEAESRAILGRWNPEALKYIAGS